MKECSSIVESSARKRKSTSFWARSTFSITEVDNALTDAHCRRKEDGVSIRTGHESRTQDATAIA